MSAEYLREAAALMRERAEVASPAPWERFASRGGRSGALELHGVRSVPIEETGDFDSEVSQSLDATDAAHIAAFASPAVALAVADWLEIEAAQFGGSEYRSAALAVANAYLGDQP